MFAVNFVRQRLPQMLPQGRAAPAPRVIPPNSEYYFDTFMNLSNRAAEQCDRLWGNITLAKAGLGLTFVLAVVGGSLVFQGPIALACGVGCLFAALVVGYLCIDAWLRNGRAYERWAATCEKYESATFSECLMRRREAQQMQQAFEPPQEHGARMQRDADGRRREAAQEHQQPPAPPQGFADGLRELVRLPRRPSGLNAAPRNL